MVSVRVFSAEYDALSRLGIEDPRGYIGSRYGNRTDSEAVLQLVSCCVGSSVCTEVEGVIEEVQASGGWADVLVSVSLGNCLQSD